MPADGLIEIIGEAMQRSPSDREAFVASVCADPATRDEALRLVAALGRAGRFMEGPGTPRTGPDGAAAMEEGPGSVLGRYTLVEPIGEGGFGVVFRAEQREPVRRTVAIKIIKLGMDTRAVVARFEAERQALAMMDHPGVAKVLDAGATPSGRPYFVMELVPGEPITRYCHDHALDLRARLELVASVCRAVQHAHTKGIIHRDLKPANILVSEVDRRPQPRIIDFGIAKATGDNLSREAFTEARQFIGTPEYMSPEQAQSPAVDVDTRSDIYSLGILLYELLTGAAPLESARLRSAPWDQMLRMIREDEPPRPSTRAAARPADAPHAPAAPAALRGDLDWIVMRCLEKDPARRYQTAESLAADLERHLRAEPVLAAPPSRAYRARKFVRRHRAGVGAASFALASLLAGLALAFWQASVAKRERDRAEERQRESAAIAEFQASQLRDVQPQLMGADLEHDLIESAAAGMQRAGLSPAEIEARKARLSEALADTNLTDVALRTLDRSVFARALTAIDDRFAGQPRVQGFLLQTLGETMRGLGLLDSAADPLRRALELRRKQFGPDSPEGFSAQTALTTLLIEQGKLAEAESLTVEALELARRREAADPRPAIDALNNLGQVRYAQGKFIEAEACAREVLERRERILGPRHVDTTRARNNLGLALVPLGRPAEAEPLFRRAWEEMRAAMGERDPDTLKALSNLGNTLRLQQKFEEAEPLLQQVLDVRRQLLGNRHPSTLRSALLLAQVHLAQGHTDQAAALHEEAVSGLLRRLGPDHPETLHAIDGLARLRLDQGRPAEAEPLLRQSLAAAERRFGPASAVAAVSRFNLGDALLGLGRFAEAESLLLEVNRAIGANPAGPEGQMTAAKLADLYEAWDKAEPGRGYGQKAAQWRARFSANPQSGGPH